MARPLANLTVLEMGTFITGPAAGMMLADLGADVIKIEQPETGDPFRAFKGGLYSPHFQTYNRNKRSITLDTRKPEDRAELDRLVATADVFIQNFRPPAPPPRRPRRESPGPSRRPSQAPRISQAPRPSPRADRRAGRRRAPRARLDVRRP